MKKVFYLAVITLIFIAGCGKSESQKKRSEEIGLHMVAEKYIKARMKDPSSTEFRNQFIGKKGAPCGEVNAKNSFGGFTGFQRYIVVGPELAVLDGDMVPGEFEISWSEICK